MCADIAARQALGVAKYGFTVQDNPLTLQRWLQHAYEECLDQAVYLRRAMQALAEQPAQQEPVAWLHPANATCVTTDPTAYARGIPLYTSPPAQRTWVGLTDEEVKAIFDSVPTASCQSYAHWRSLVALAIENKLREKNT